MAGKETKLLSEWIVLIRKSPAGPFTEAQIREHLTNGTIRINDLAHQLTADEDATLTPEDWRFLWQYSEFDRRKGELPDPERDRKYERRRTPTPQVLERERNLALPTDLQDLSPKVLLEKSRQAWNQEREALGLPASRARVKERSFLSRAMWPTVFAVVGIGTAIYFRSELQRHKPETPRVGRQINHRIFDLEEPPPATEAQKSPPLKKAPKKKKLAPPSTGN